MSSPLWITARIGTICRGCELEISGTLLTVDLSIMDMSKLDVILGMDWLIAYRIVIDCERKKSYRLHTRRYSCGISGGQACHFAPDSIRV